MSYDLFIKNGTVAVMPAEAGIQKPRPFALDSRFRGNDAATVYPSTSH